MDGDGVPYPVGGFVCRKTAVCHCLPQGKQCYALQKVTASAKQWHTVQVLAGVGMRPSSGLEAEVAAVPAALRDVAGAHFPGRTRGAPRRRRVGGRNTPLSNQLGAAAGRADRLLLPANEDFKPVAAVAADVFVDRHASDSPKSRPRSLRPLLVILLYWRLSRNSVGPASRRSGGNLKGTTVVSRTCGDSWE